MENDLTFVAPEGVYSLTDEHKPNHAQGIAASAGPHLYPSKISTVVVRYPATLKQGLGGAQGLAQLLGGGGNKLDPKKDKTEKSTKDRDDGVSLSSSDTPEGSDQPASSSQEQHPASNGLSSEPHTLFSAQPVPGKKKSITRPKHNLKTTSSTFITRIQNAEGMTKTLQAKTGDINYLFYNACKSFVWIEAGSKVKEPLTRITFSAYPTCHDVNISTALPERLDVIMGFNTGDLVWLDPIHSRYTRLNKQGSISGSPCTAVRWVPGSSTLFLASHADGTIIIYDVEREDGSFTPQDPNPPTLVSSSSNSTAAAATNSTANHLNGAPADSTNNHPLNSAVDALSQIWDPLDSIFVTMPPWHPAAAVTTPSNVPTKPGKADVAKNPVSHWRLSRRGIADFVFSPDVKYVAAISEDGCLRVIDALSEVLVDCYASYFGALTCIAWSPDGRFILTGGQDDLLTIFSPWEQRVIARCQGHSSFVSAVAFDDLRCDGRTYRFGSVGEDNKLILWDFSSSALHRPKFQATHHQRMSISSSISLAFRRDRSAQYLPSVSSPHIEGVAPSRYHPAPSRNEVAFVQPVLVKQHDVDLLTTVQFMPRYLLTACKSGLIKLWIRPLALRPRQLKSPRLAPLIDVQDLV